jgi:hypothetical protein
MTGTSKLSSAFNSAVQLLDQAAGCNFGCGGGDVIKRQQWCP